jgi:hypothetical protein
MSGWRTSPRVVVPASFVAGVATSILLGFALRFLWVAYRHGGMW